MAEFRPCAVNAQSTVFINNQKFTVEQFVHIGGVLLTIEGDESSFRSSGLILDERLYPSMAVRSCRRGKSKERVTRLDHGRLRFRVESSLVLSLDTSFVRFKDCLLADKQLSLVKGERHA